MHQQNFGLSAVTRETIAEPAIHVLRAPYAVYDHERRSIAGVGSDDVVAQRLDVRLHVRLACAVQTRSRLYQLLIRGKALQDSRILPVLSGKIEYTTSREMRAEIDRR
ncbi:MAG: hypothetical protein ACRELT_05375, partial [Longimicrobiales bacterium]